MLALNVTRHDRYSTLLLRVQIQIVGVYCARAARLLPRVFVLALGHARVQRIVDVRAARLFARLSRCHCGRCLLLLLLIVKMNPIRGQYTTREIIHRHGFAVRILNRQYLRGHKLAVEMAHVHGLNLRMVVARRLLRNRHHNHIGPVMGV